MEKIYGYHVAEVALNPAEITAEVSMFIQRLLCLISLFQQRARTYFLRHQRMCRGIGRRSVA